MKYTSIIKRIQSEINKVTLYLQNCEIRKQEIQKNMESSKDLYMQIMNLINTQKENNRMKRELSMKNYSETIDQVRHKKEKITKKLHEQINQIKLFQQDEKLIKKKMKKIENNIKEEQNFEECLNSKLKKYNDAIERSNKIINDECERLNKEFEKIEIQINQAKSQDHNNYDITNPSNANLKTDNFNYQLCQLRKNISQYNSEQITKYTNDLAEVNYENMLLKQKILSAKKKIIESKIEFTELEQKAAALLKASVEKQKQILINQEQRDIAHEDYVTDTMIAIQQAKAKIIMNKAIIDSTSAQNKFASKMLKHVMTCCSTKESGHKYIFIPENYIYLSQ